MAQQQWTVSGYGGIPYNVGLYHGTKTGHLLVQCSGKILIIDFGVTKDKEYSFMLGEELYELKIIKKENHFDYIFKHNEEVGTPHNIRRTTTEKTDKRRLRAVFIIFTLLIISLLGIRFYWTNLEKNIREQLANGEGVSTQTRLLKEGDQWMIIYKVEGKLIKRQLLEKDTISAFGFPLQTGDRYQARIIPGHKYVYHIDWGSADESIKQRFIELTFQTHQTLHPELAPRQALCQIQIAYHLEKLEGLAKVYKQASISWPIYNQDAYLRLIRGIEFRTQEKGCL